MLKRLATLAAALVVCATVSVAMVAVPASALPAPPSCPASIWYARWTTQQGFRYTPGTWCMKDGEQELIWQSDGNLVWYTTDGIGRGRVIWATDTYNQGAWTLTFQIDGNIVIRHADGHPMWAIGHSTDRWPNTVFYWTLRFQDNICGLSSFDTYRLEQWQIDPDHTLYDWKHCLP